MRRTYPLSFFRLACLLLIFVALWVPTEQKIQPKTSACTQTVSACSDSPAVCKAPVKSLGESKAGCACFACDYGKKTQKVLCTNKVADKTSFRRLVPKTTRTK